MELKLPDGSVLMHGSAPYDPAKAHEYYLKNRELKGRKKGSTQQPKSRSTGVTKPTSFTVQSARGTVKLSPRQLAEQQAYARERVNAISTKINKLESALRKKMAEAKTKERESKKPDSAAEKAEKARDAEKYRDKNKQSLKNKAKQASEKKSGHDLDTVSGLKDAIASAKASLTKAIDRQRALASAKQTG